MWAILFLKYHYNASSEFFNMNMSVQYFAMRIVRVQFRIESNLFLTPLNVQT